MNLFTVIFKIWSNAAKTSTFNLICFTCAHDHC